MVKCVFTISVYFCIFRIVYRRTFIVLQLKIHIFKLIPSILILLSFTHTTKQIQSELFIYLCLARCFPLKIKWLSPLQYGSLTASGSKLNAKKENGAFIPNYINIFQFIQFQFECGEYSNITTNIQLTTAYSIGYAQFNNYFSSET